MSFPHSQHEYEDQERLIALEKRFQEEREGKAMREFPEGRLSGDDDGSITFKIGADEEKYVVAIEYSKPVHWVAMPPQQAMEFAQLLIKRARSIAKEPLRIYIN